MASPSPSGSAAETALHAAELWYPVVLLLAFITVAAGHSIVTSRSEEEISGGPVPTGPGGRPLPVRVRRRRPPSPDEIERTVGRTARRVFRYLSAAVVLTFIANGSAVAIRTLNDHFAGDDDQRWWCGEQRTIYIAGGAFLYLYYLITLFEWQNSPNFVHGFIWFLSLIGETVILLCSLAVALGPHYVIKNVRTRSYAHVSGPDHWDLLDLGIAASRLCLVGGLELLYCALALKRYLKDRNPRRVEEARGRPPPTAEQQPLLGTSGPDYHTHSEHDRDDSHPRAEQSDASSTGTAADVDHKTGDEDAGFYRPKKVVTRTWWEYCRDYAIFFPYLWPSNVPKLQMAVLICFILLLCQRVVNILVPYQIGVVTDSLESSEGSKHMPWVALGLLVVYKLLQGQSGALGSIRTVLWVPVSQHTYRALVTAAFQHVHSLSLDFHLKKRTGEIQSALNKGSAINAFLEQITFQVFPMLLDLLIAIVFFYINFSAMYALFVSVITFFYLHVTIRMAATRAQQRREMSNADREEEALKNESIVSYETIKYFNAEKFEFQRYDNAIAKFQTAEAKVIWGTSHMNICQALVFLCGILVAMMMGAYEVTQGTRTVGDFVLLITYLQQLQGPLNFFGSFYRTVQQAMIQGERLLELFKYQPTVVDMPGVPALSDCKGHVRFDNVKFYYDERRTALRNLSFECKPGTTTAFVGESGGGKSTVFRLMFRYYNCQEGRIEIDGKDVREVTIDSVRRAIGVVPQDTTLFNDTLMYNLKYANPTATDEDVYEACRAAAIHERILNFPDGYRTIVGERGLRLSGGEKQRVAIARTILKNPRIIMLDEATSALDGETEQEIHSRMFSGSWGQDRTLLIIAHRLSTITHADQIIVLHDGGIAEKGTHEELLSKNGRYASMWEKHCRAERAIEVAYHAHRRAEKLIRQAKIPRKEYDGDGSDGCNSIASSTLLQTGPPSPREGSIDFRHDDETSNASSSDGESSRSHNRRGLPESR